MAESIMKSKGELVPLNSELWRFIDLETSGLSIKHGATIEEIAVISDKVEYHWVSKDARFVDQTILFFLKNTILVGHNVLFDLRFLFAFTKRSCPISVRFVDTIPLAKKLGWPLRLSSIVRKFDLELESHQAIDDAIACRFVFDSYVEKFGKPPIRRMTREPSL